MNIEANCPNCMKSYVENQYKAKIQTYHQSNETMQTDTVNNLRFNHEYNDELMPPNINYLAPPMPRMDLNNNDPRQPLNTPRPQRINLGAQMQNLSEPLL